MNAADGKPERGFLDWSLLYLFSYDVELDLTRQEVLGERVGGVRMNCFARPDLSRVYNIGRDKTLRGSGQKAISGRVVMGRDQLLLRDDDVAVSDITLNVATDDGDVIRVHYRLIGYVGPGGVRRIVEGKGDDSLGTEDQPFEAPLVTSPRFETASPNYAWLNGLQGIGFGRAQLVRSKFRRITCDVYALS